METARYGRGLIRNGPQSSAPPLIDAFVCAYALSAVRKQLNVVYGPARAFPGGGRTCDRSSLASARRHVYNLYRARQAKGVWMPDGPGKLDRPRSPRPTPSEVAVAARSPGITHGSPPKS